MVTDIYSTHTAAGPGKTWTAVVVFFAAVVIVVATFALTASFSRKEKVVGILSVEPPITSISSIRGGRVESIKVASGMNIRAGDILIEVNPNPSLIGGQNAAGLQIESLTATKTEATNSLKSLSDQYHQKSIALKQRQKNLLEMLQSAQKAVELQARNVALANTQLKDKKRLSIRNPGTVTSSVLQTQESALNLQEAELLKLTLAEQQFRDDLYIVESNQIQLPLELANSESEIKQRIFGIDTQLVDALQIRNYQLTATVGGLVDTVFVSEGQVVPENAKLIGILPEKSFLIAELYIPSRSAAFVAVDQELNIAIDAFPFEHFGFMKGKIKNVSNVLLKPEEISGPIAVAEASYRITAILHTQTV